MTPFNEMIRDLNETAIDFRTAILAANAAHREARELIAAVDERLASEQAQVKARIAELTKKVSDPRCSETVRRMALMELDELSKKVLSPSTAEASEFQAKLDELQQAAADAVDLRKRLADLFREVGAALSEYRANTLGAQINDTVVLGRLSTSLKEDFENLIAKWNAEAQQ